MHRSVPYLIGSQGPPPPNPSILAAYGFSHEWSGSHSVSQSAGVISAVGDLIGGLSLTQPTSGDRPIVSPDFTGAIKFVSNDFLYNDNGTSDGHGSTQILVNPNADFCMISHFQTSGATPTAAVITTFCIGSASNGTFAQIGYYKDANLAVVRWNSSSFQFVPSATPGRITMALIRSGGNMMYSLNGGAKTGSASLSGQDINVTTTLSACMGAKRANGVNSEYCNFASGGVFICGVGQVVPSDADLSAIHTAFLAI